MYCGVFTSFASCGELMFQDASNLASRGSSMASNLIEFRQKSSVILDEVIADLQDNPFCSNSFITQMTRIDESRTKASEKLTILRGIDIEDFVSLEYNFFFKVRYNK